MEMGEKRQRMNEGEDVHKDNQKTNQNTSFKSVSLFFPISLFQNHKGISIVILFETIFFLIQPMETALYFSGFALSSSGHGVNWIFF